MPRELVNQLYDEIVKQHRCRKGQPVPNDIIDLAQRLRDFTRIELHAKEMALVQAEKLILCLDSLQEQFIELDYLLSSTLYNILLQNRALLWQMGMKDDIEFFSITLGYTVTSCIAFIKKKQPTLVVPKNIFQMANYTDLTKERCKVLETDEEYNLMMSKISLFYLLTSQKIPDEYFEDFIKRFFTKFSFIFLILLMDIGNTIETTIETAITTNGHSCSKKQCLPLFIALYRASYAFSCNYEERLWNLAEREDWLHRIASRWSIFMDQIMLVIRLCLGMYLREEFYEEDRLKMKLALSVASLLLLPRWEMIEHWLLKNGIESFYDMEVLYLKLVKDNFTHLNQNKLYSKPGTNFNFVNLEILPLVSLLNHILLISEKYSKVTQRPNRTNAIYRYALCGKDAGETLTPEDLGISKRLFDIIPNLKPQLMEVLKEPLLVGINKEIMQIYTRLGLHMEIPKETKFFVNMKEHGEFSWNLTAVQMASGNIERASVYTNEELKRLQEADDIMQKIWQISYRKNG